MGRVTNDGVRTYVWDGASRLTSYSEGGFTESFSYDAFGRMLSRSQGALVHTFVWNYSADVATLDIDRRATGDPNDAQFLIRAPGGELLYAIDGLTDTRRYYHYDEDGNTIFLTSDPGYVVAAYSYLPLGERRSIGQTGGNSFSYHCYQGFLELASPSGGLYCGPGVGPYDAKTGRYLAPQQFSVPVGPGGAPGAIHAIVDGAQSSGVLFDYSSSTKQSGSFEQGIDPWRFEIKLDTSADPFFKSVGGLKVEQEVVDYPEGGARTTPYRRGPKRISWIQRLDKDPGPISMPLGIGGTNFDWTVNPGPPHIGAPEARGFPVVLDDRRLKTFEGGPTHRFIGLYTDLRFNGVHVGPIPADRYQFGMVLGVDARPDPPKIRPGQILEFDDLRIGVHSLRIDFRPTPIQINLNPIFVWWRDFP
jgi:YD repeat-containing protein